MATRRRTPVKKKEEVKEEVSKVEETTEETSEETTEETSEETTEETSEEEEGLPETLRFRKTLTIPLNEVKKGSNILVAGNKLTRVKSKKGTLVSEEYFQSVYKKYKSKTFCDMNGNKFDWIISDD